MVAVALPAQLPGQNTDVWDWQLQASCRGADWRTFFSPDGERGRARSTRETRAKQMCHQCPVIAECRAHALQVQEPYGTWGGLTEAERARITGGTGNRRPYGRPTAPRLDTFRMPTDDTDDGTGPCADTAQYAIPLSKLLRQNAIRSHRTLRLAESTSPITGIATLTDRRIPVRWAHSQN